MLKNSEVKLCAKCGSPLVERERSTKQLGNSQFPILTVSYRCSNDDCQEDTDQKIAEHIRQIQEREEKKALKNSNHKGK